MKKTFNDMVNESRDELEIIDSHALDTLMKDDKELVIIDVNDKEETDERGMIKGAINALLDGGVTKWVEDGYELEK